MRKRSASSIGEAGGDNVGALSTHWAVDARVRPSSRWPSVPLPCMPELRRSFQHNVRFSCGRTADHCRREGHPMLCIPSVRCLLLHFPPTAVLMPSPPENFARNYCVTASPKETVNPWCKPWRLCGLGRNLKSIGGSIFNPRNPWKVERYLT
jgi:hypothetical protein